MKKYHGIQILRCIAASLVVVEHASNNVIRHWTNAPVMPAYGEVGVYLFFGISGFIMLSTQANERADIVQAVNFFIRRLLRVLPIYVFATSLQFINKFRYGPDYNFLNYLKSLLFIPYIGDGGNFRPILGQGWTLNYEMFFYFVFAISLLFSRMRRLTLCVLVFGALSLLQDSAQHWPEVLAFYANRIMLFFLCGMLVALVLPHLAKFLWFVQLPISLLYFACATLIVGGLLATYQLSPSEVFCYYLVMVFACVLLAAQIMHSTPSWGLRNTLASGVDVAPRNAAMLGQSEARRRKRCLRSKLFEVPSWSSQLFTSLGDASYSTYLFHGFLLGALKFISQRIGPERPIWMLMFLLLCVVLANLIGLFAYRFLEQPIAKRLKDIRWRPRGSFAG